MSSHIKIDQILHLKIALFQIFFHKHKHSFHKYLNASSLPDIYGGTYPLLEISESQWYEILKHGDQEFESKSSM